MRRFAVLVAAGAAMISAACSDAGTNDASTTRATSAFDAPAATTVVADERASEATCAGKDAANIGLAYASALRPDGADYDELAEGLRRAVAAAPEEIRTDFRLLVDAQLPFLEALANAKSSGDYAALSQTPQFQETIDRLGSAQVAEASSRVNLWFSQHCS